MAILKNVVFLSRPFWISFFEKKNFFCFFLMKISQRLLVSKDGSKFWSSQTWQHFLTETKHFDGEYIYPFLYLCIRDWNLNLFNMKLGYDNVLDNHSDPSFWQKKQASILKCIVILYEAACIFLSASIFTKYLCQSIILI